MSLGFGKYREVPLDQVPESYLFWVLEQRWVWDSTKAMVERELDDRQWQQRFQQAYEAGRKAREEQQAAHREPRGVDGVVALEIVKRGYRSLALEAHPDKGGDPEEMKAVNAAATWLRGTVARMLPAGTNGSGDERLRGVSTLRVR